MKSRPEIAAYALAALVVICITALSIAHVAVPSVLEGVLLVASGAGAGVSHPRGASPADTPARRVAAPRKAASR